MVKKILSLDLGIISVNYIILQEYGFSSQDALLDQEKQNFYTNKWELRTQKAFQEKLQEGELFTTKI